MDIFVNPSYAEGLPTTVLEAGISGLNIIATDVGGTREIIQKSKNCIIIEPKKIEFLKTSLKSMVLKKKNQDLKKYILNTYEWLLLSKKFYDLIKKVK
jgi:glycosyltransferase involved in cell wall biosynthesis